MIEQIPEKIAGMLNYIPFLTLIIKDQPTPVTTRLIETGIMSVIAAVGGMYVAVPLIQKDIEVLNVNIQRIDDKVEKVDEKVERLRGDLYTPRGGYEK